MCTFRIKNSKCIEIRSNTTQPIIIITMSAVRRSTDTDIQHMKQPKITKNKLQFGRSHIDYVNGVVLYHVYLFMYPLGLKSTLNRIPQLRKAVDSEIVAKEILWDTC